MSRAARTNRLRRRPSRVIPASIVAVVLLALGVLALLAAVQRFIDGSWSSLVSRSAGAVAGVTWGSAIATTVAVVALVVGLVLLLAAVIPGAYRAAPLGGGTGGSARSTDFVITNRGMARLATATADAVDGVGSVSASASGSTVLVRVTTPSRQADLVRDRVRTALGDRFAAAGVQPAPRIKVTVQTKEI